MKIENETSINNMLINAYYMDKEEYRRENNRYKIIYKMKELFDRAKRGASHITKIRQYGLKKTINNISAEINPHYLYDYTIPYDFDHNMEFEYKFQHSIPNKIAVYTSIFGNYDSLKEPFYVNDKCDFFVITDSEVPVNSVWKRLSIKQEEFNKLDYYHKSKYCKLHPHLLFPEYEYSIWIDGNVQVVADLTPLVDRMEEMSSMATFQNPLHDCIYTEEKFLYYHNAANYEVLHKQVTDYKAAGFPAHYGMREFSIIVRKHNDAQLIDLMNQWWKEVNKYSMRDQISFPYILWKNGFSIDYIGLLGSNWRYNPRFIYVDHNWRHKL